MSENDLTAVVTGRIGDHVMVADADAAKTRRRFDLHAVVLGHETRADRCTIYPRDRPRTERLETRLSADADAFVLLRDVR